MARVQLVIEWPTLSAADLRALVVAHDLQESGDEPVIETNKVRARDVVMLWARGELAPNLEPSIEMEVPEEITVEVLEDY